MPRRRVWALATAAAALASVGAFVALASTPAEQPEPDLTHASRFREYRVFHLGRRYGSLPLTHVGRGRDGLKGRPTFSFIYGDCEAESDSGCAPPYEIQNYASCSRNPMSYPPGRRGRRRPSIRGAAVYEWSDGGEFDRLEAYTGKTTVVVFAPDARGARGAVRALRSADGTIRPGEQLPRPAAGAVRGKLACRE